MKTEFVYSPEPSGAPEGKYLLRELMPGEIFGLKLEMISMTGYHLFSSPLLSLAYDVFLVIQGKGTVLAEGQEYGFGPGYVIKPPWPHPFSIEPSQGESLYLLRIRISQTPEDVGYISNQPEHFRKLYLKAITDCSVYTEDIKSSKTVNRMILPEGMVPRFCMGSVETSGPDRVAEHEHPMLDQLFLGLKGCRGHCYAGGDYALLEENMLLHIPLGSRHRVEVREGDRLAYIWFDFFLTLEGQKYMNEQHRMEDP